MENVQNITLDILNNKTYEYIYTKQYDKGRTVIFNITEDGIPWGENGIQCVFELMKPDGFCIINELEYNATDKTVTLVLDDQCTAVAGRLPYQLVFKKDDVIISTVTGKILCEKAVIQNGEIRSTSSGNLIEDLMELYDNNVFEARRVVLKATDWVNSIQIIAVPGVVEEEAHQLVTIHPSAADTKKYAEAEIMCTAQNNGSLTFECVTTPTEDIDIFVGVQGIDSRLGNISFTYASSEPNKFDQNEDDIWVQDYGVEYMEIDDGEDPWEEPSHVEVTPILESGVNIATITVNDVPYQLYTPNTNVNDVYVNGVTSLDGNGIAQIDITKIVNEWRSFNVYYYGEYVSRNGTLYRCKNVMGSISKNWTASDWEEVTINELNKIILNFAPIFGVGTTYNIGDLCTKDNKLYRCNTNNTRGNWVAAKWDEVTVADLMTSISPTYSSIRIDDTNGDIILTNNTTWDGTHTSLKDTISALVSGGGGGGLTPVQITPEDYEQLSPAQKADTSKLYFVEEEEES